MNKNWKGAVISGRLGEVYIYSNSLKCDEYEKTSIEKKLDRTFNCYQPWMSNLSYPKEMSILNKLEIEDDFFVSSKSFSLFEAIFTQRNKNIFSMIHQDLQSSFCLNTPKNSDYLDNRIKLKSTLDVLLNIDREYFDRFRKLICHILIQKGKEGHRIREAGTGMSSFNYRKGIFLSIPTCEYWQFELLLNLSHELGHQALITLQKRDHILLSSHFHPVYSVIRKTERPAILSFHALTASIYMLEFIIRNYDDLLNFTSDDYLHERFKNIKKDVRSGLQIFKHSHFSPLGAKIFDEYLALYIEASKYER